MKIKLENLKKLSQQQLLVFWSQIDASETSILIDGGDFSTSITDFSRVYDSFNYLPPHISHMTFQGKFEYVRTSFTYESGTQIFTENSVYENIGGYLSYLVAHIPQQITSLKFSLFLSLEEDDFYDYLYSKISRDMRKILKNIPKHVTHLDLSELCYEGGRESNWDDIVSMYQMLPKTIQVLKIHDMDWWNCPSHIFDKVFKLINSSVAHVIWPRFSIPKHSLAIASQLFGGSIKKLGLKEKGFRDRLMQNYADKTEAQPFMQILPSIASNILALDLSDNDFYTLAMSEFRSIIELIPKHIQDLDIGENGLTHFKPDIYLEILSKLPPNIQKLRLIDKLFQYHDFTLPLHHYEHIPEQICELSFANSRHLKLSFYFYLQVLKVLPKTIHTLDFSNSSLVDYDDYQIDLLVASIPEFIKKIIFRKNDLANQDLLNFARTLAKFPITIKEIDIAENGLEKLKYSSLSYFLNCLPDRVYHLGFDKITLTHDGRLLPYYPRANDVYFKPITKLKIQHEFPIFFSCMNQMMRQKKLSPVLLLNICSFLYDLNGHTFGTSFKNNLLKSSFFVTQSEEQTKQQLHLGISRRMQHCLNLTLDLSHSGLHRFDESDDFMTIFRNIPKHVQILNLRQNHLDKPKAFKAFQQALAFLPKQILYLDLSANGFSACDSSFLHQFSNLPKTLKFVSFGYERPVSLEEHIKRTQIPAYLPKLLVKSTPIMEKAKILLNDYTQGNSRFWRFIFGFWNRKHIPEISRLIYFIAQGYYEFIEDIIHQLNILEMNNESGALSKSILLLSQEVTVWRDFRVNDGARVH